MSFQWLPGACTIADTLIGLSNMQDDRINRAEILFPGVGCFLIAAILGLFVHASNTDDINAKLGIKRGHWLRNVTAKESHKAPAPLGAQSSELCPSCCAVKMNLGSLLLSG
jgi:hypothetical protein